MKTMQERDARLVFDACYDTWSSGSLPSDWTDLQRALYSLLQKKGGREWITLHPDVLVDDQEVLHGAGFRLDELIARSTIVIVEYECRPLYIRPHHGVLLRGSYAVQTIRRTA